MARSHRFESSDGLYHVLNRGNYRSEIFETEGARTSFVKTLFEAGNRFSWRLHAYCVLSNHFHLCLSTPLGNLSSGMRWLQATFALRFNGYRREHGHLFQGRFKSLVVEPGRHWCDLVDYIHLNPVRAGMADQTRLDDYRWSSLPVFPKAKSRSALLDCSWMDYSNDFSDTPSGWNRYRLHLRMKTTTDPKENEVLNRKMSRGWCIGDKQFKQTLAEEIDPGDPAVRLEQGALVDLNEQKWTNALQRCLRQLDKTGNDIAIDLKSSRWKLAVASRLRRSTSVSNAWLSRSLNMGTARSVSAICGKYQREEMQHCRYWSKLKELTFDH